MPSIGGEPTSTPLLKGVDFCGEGILEVVYPPLLLGYLGLLPGIVLGLVLG